MSAQTIELHEVLPQEVYTEAYDYLLDECPDEIEDYLSYAECENAIQAHYAGGWAAWVKSCGAFIA